MNDSLYNFITDPNPKRRDLLNLAIENIELIQRTEGIKELRERKSIIMTTLKDELDITNKALRHFHSLMPVKIKEEHERVQEKIEKSKVKIVEKQKIEKIDSLSMELDDIKNKLNSLSF